MKKHLPLLLLTVSNLVLRADDLPPRPNIVLVMADDQGWGDTGYNGYGDAEGGFAGNPPRPGAD